MNNNEVKNSGTTRSFGENGAHRDGGVKGLPTDAPLLITANLKKVKMPDGTYIPDPFHMNIGMFQRTKDSKYLYEALYGTMLTVPEFKYENVVKKMAEMDMPLADADVIFENDPEGKEEHKRQVVMSYMMLEVAYLYEAGGNKYGRNNWRKGMPIDVYLCSALRHYYKAVMPAIDEPHYRAVVWNILGALWTIDNKPGALDEFELVI